MTPDLQNTSMDIDSPGGSKAMPENGLNLYSVSAADSGEGLPYAPEDFPNPGDKWGWKVGRRLAASGHFLDRYVYLPKSLSESGNRKGFASKLAFEQYIRDKFPDTDINAFFASFSWRIPSAACKKDYKETPTPLKKDAEDPDGKLHCKAGNRFCSSLAGGEDSVSRVMSCDICCSEPGFCRDCCCILCCRTIDKASSDSYITCEANIEGSICGHSCHIECALRAYMAGTVGGSIGLDAEYYCRRCDSRTDLVPHFKKILEDSGESIVLRDGIEKVLRIGVCALRGSKKTSAKQLLKRIELAVSKLENGNCFEDIWKKDDISAGSADQKMFSQLRAVDAEEAPVTSPTPSRDEVAAITPIEGTPDAADPNDIAPPTRRKRSTSTRAEPSQQKAKNASSSTAPPPPAAQKAITMPPSLILPKPDSNELVDFLQSFQYAHDQSVLSKLPEEELHRRSCAALSHLFGVYANRGLPSSKSQQEISRLKGEIKKMKAGAASHIEQLKARISATDGRIVELKAELDRQRAATAVERREAFRSFPTSAEGRALLDEYRQELLAMFPNSPDFLTALFPFTEFAVKHTVRLAQEDVTASGSSLVLNPRAIMLRLPEKDMPSCWKPLKKREDGQPWWNTATEKVLEPYGVAEAAPGDEATSAVEVSTPAEATSPGEFPDEAGDGQ